MMTRYYRFAGVGIAISMPEELFFEEEQKLAAFRADQQEDTWMIRFEKADTLPEPAGTLVLCEPSMRVYQDKNRIIRYFGFCGESWEEARMWAEYRDKETCVKLKESEFTGRVNVQYVLEAIAAEHMIARQNGFVFHCSYIEYQGKAVLFTAPSETGKSTQAELWNRYRDAQIINGDRAAIRLVDGVIMADGVPFSGSSQHCKNRSLPIEAVVYLAQAPETSIRKLRGYEAFAKIWEGVSVNTWDKEDLERVSSVVKALLETVPIFHMPCTPDESAVIVLESTLTV